MERWSEGGREVGGMKVGKGGREVGVEEGGMQRLRLAKEGCRREGAREGGRGDGGMEKEGQRWGGRRDAGVKHGEGGVQEGGMEGCRGAVGLSPQAALALLSLTCQVIPLPPWRQSPGSPWHLTRLGLAGTASQGEVRGGRGEVGSKGH